MALWRMWGAGRAAGRDSDAGRSGSSSGSGMGGGSAATGRAAGGSSATEDVTSATEKARLHFSEQQAAAAAAQSPYSATAGVSTAGSAPLAVLPPTRSFSATGYRQSAQSIALSSSSSSAAATPLYSPQDWTRHLPLLATHSLEVSTPSSLSSASSPTARSLADLHFAAAGSGGSVGGVSTAGVESGQWQPQSSASSPFAPPFPPATFFSAPSTAAPRGVLPLSSHSSPYSASPSNLSPTSSVSRDEDVWALEVAKINRQAAQQQYAAQQQQQQRLSATSVPAVPLGPPVSRPSSAQSKLFSLLSRTEDEVLKRQQHQQYQPTRHQQLQSQQSVGQPPYQQSVPSSEASPQQSQRRGSARHSQYGVASVEQVASLRSSPTLHRASPASLLFTAPPPPQSRSSSTPQSQTRSGAMSVRGAAPTSESATLTFGKKLVTARSPSPRTLSANQPFQPRESFSGFPSFAYTPLPIEPQQSHRYSMSDTLSVQPQHQRQPPLLPATLEPPSFLSGPRSAPLSPTSAEVAAAASAYLISEQEPQTEHPTLASFLSSAQQQPATHTFDWHSSQQQQQQRSSMEQRDFPPYGLSQVQSVTVHHILADRPKEQQYQKQQQREQSVLFSSTAGPLLAASSVSSAQSHLSPPTARRSPSPHIPLHSSFQAEASRLPFNPATNPLARPVNFYSASASSSAPSLPPFPTFQLLSAAGVMPSSHSQPSYEGAVSATSGVSGRVVSISGASAGPMYADMQQQQQQQAQQSSVPSAEFPFFSHSRLPWLSGAALPPFDFPPELAARHRSFIAVGLPSEAEARVKAEEDDAEMERILAQQQRQQLERESPPQSQLAAKSESGVYQQVYHPAGSSASAVQQQRYYVPAPSPALGLTSDLPLSTPVFSSSMSPSATTGNIQVRGERPALEYAAALVSEAGQQRYQLSGLSSSIPAFSSSMSSDPRLPAHSNPFHSHGSALPSALPTSSVSSLSAATASTKRRAAGAVSTAELWVCPFNCNKVGRRVSPAQSPTTSTQPAIVSTAQLTSPVSPHSLHSAHVRCTAPRRVAPSLAISRAAPTSRCMRAYWQLDGQQEYRAASE